MDNGNTYITWRAFWTAIGGLLILGGGLQSFLWQLHISQPHAGAITQQEVDRLLDAADKRSVSMNNLIERLESRLERMENKIELRLDRLENKLEGITGREISED